MDQIESLHSIRNKIWRIFQEFDKNGDGFISPGELRQLLAYHGETISDTDLMDMIVEADIDGDGVVGFCDFVQLLLSLHSQLFGMVETMRNDFQIKQNRLLSTSTGCSSCSCDESGSCQNYTSIENDCDLAIDSATFLNLSPRASKRTFKQVVKSVVKRLKK